MAIFCITTSNPEFQKLLAESGEKQGVFAMMVSKWMTENEVYDRYPTLQELGITAMDSIKPGVPELFESNPELANVVYKALGFRVPNITVLPNGNLKIVAFRTEKVGPTSKGEYQRGKGLYLSLDKPYPGEDVYTVELEISPKNLLDRKLGFGEISEDYFIDEKNKRVDRQLDTLHEFKQSLGIKAEIGSIDGALMNELVLFDKELIDKALTSKQVYNPQQKQQAQQLYSQYLDTVFPDSQVKDIVYHGSPKMSKSNAAKLLSKQKFTEDEYNSFLNSKFDTFDFSKSGSQSNSGIKGAAFFTTNPKVASFSDNYIYQAILNITDNIQRVDYQNELIDLGHLKKLVDNSIGFDRKGLIIENVIDSFENDKNKLGTTIAVFKPEQIHILGSKQDIEGFKKFVDKSKVKQGVSELFESNPELANAVYEALGFKEYSKETKSKLALTERLKDLFKDKSTVLFRAGDNTDAFYIDLVKTSDDRYFYFSEGQSPEEISKERFAEEVEFIDGQIATTKEKDAFIKNFLDIADLNQISENPLLTKEEKIEAQKDILKKVTPQQKQEAQQLYNSYLQTTNNPTIEGFKQWNNRQQQVKELFESNESLANSVYEAAGVSKQSLLNIVADSLGVKINSLNEKELLDYLENNKSNIRFDFLNESDKINNDKIYNLIRNNGNISEINKLISQSKNLAVNNKILPKGLKFTNTGYTIISNATNFEGITFQTGGTVKIKSVITSDTFNGKNINSHIITDNASDKFRENANKKFSDSVYKKISKYQSILNTGLAPKKNFEHTVLITSNSPLGYTLGLKGESWNIEIGADTEKFSNELYEKFRIVHIGNRKLSIDKPLGWVGGKIINNTLVITELQSDLLQNTFEIPKKVSGISKSSVENYFDGWEYVFLQTAINQMKEKYPNITYVSLPSSDLYTEKVPGAINISKLYDKLSKEYNFSKTKKQLLNIQVIPVPIDEFQSKKGFIVTDEEGKKETFTISVGRITSDKGYSKTIPFDKFNKIIVNKGKKGIWRVFNPEQAVQIIQSFTQNDSYFNKYQDNKYTGFNVIKLSKLSKPITNNFTKEYYDVYIKTYLRSFVKEMKISNPGLASDFELAYDAMEFSKDDINLKQFYNSEYGIEYLEKLNEWIEKEFSKDVPTQDIADNTGDGGVLVDSSGNEIDETYEETEIDRLIKNTNKKEVNNDYTFRDQDYLLDELNRAIKEKNKVRQDVIKQILTEINIKGNSSIKYDNNGKIQGFTHNGNIFLNKDAENKTLIEEAGHLWLDKIKTINPALYSEGLEKIKNSVYVQKVLNNSFYVKEALKLGNESSKEYQNYILEEALSKSIKDEGSKLSSNDKQSFLKWLIQLYNELLKLSGLQNKRIEDVKKMSLQEFSKEALYDIFNIKEKGKKVSESFLQQKATAQQLYSQYLESLNKPNTNPILQGNQQEQVKKFAELQERLNNKEFLEGAKNAYESTPALQQFGTQEQYNDYIARVSLGIIKNPSSGEYNYTSKVKDIVYHGANEPIEGEKFAKREGATGRGIWFSGSKKYAQIQMDRAQPSESLIGRKLRGAPTMYQVVLNIKNPKNFYNATGALLVQTPSKFEEQYDRKTDDAALFHHPNSKKPATADSADQVVVFEPEQIHILGSKQDIEGFREFVQGETKTADVGLAMSNDEAIAFNSLVNDGTISIKCE